MKNTDAHIFHVLARDVQGKKNKKLLNQGKIPANIFGLGEASAQISIDTAVIARHLKEQGDSGLVYLQIGEGKQLPVLIEEVQSDALTGQPIHISFKRVNMNVKIVSEVALELTGTLEVANATALLTQNVLSVEALPADLPEGIVIDISGLTEVGQGIYVKDLSIDHSKVTVLMSDEEKEQPLVIVKEVKEEVAEEVTDSEPATEEGASAPAEAPATEDKAAEKAE